MGEYERQKDIAVEGQRAAVWYGARDAEDRISDIADALLAVTRAFRKHGMEPPASLAVPHETYDTLRLTRQGNGVDYVYSREHRHRPRMEIVGYGIEEAA